MVSLIFLQDLSNKDMKRDLYIVSQVIRTGEYPVSFSLFSFLSLLLSISFIWSQTSPQGSTFLPAPASLERLHKCAIANSSFKFQFIAGRATGNETKLFLLLRTEQSQSGLSMAILTSFVKYVEIQVIFRYYGNKFFKLFQHSYQSSKL